MISQKRDILHENISHMSDVLDRSSLSQSRYVMSIAQRTKELLAENPVKECPELTMEREANRKLVKELETRLKQLIQKVLDQDEALRGVESENMRMIQENGKLREQLLRNSRIENEHKDVVDELEFVKRDLATLKRWKAERLEEDRMASQDKEGVIARTRLENAEKDLEMLQTDLNETRDQYSALRRKLDEREAAFARLKEYNVQNENEIARLQHVLNEREHELKMSQTLFAHGQAIKPSVPSIPEASRAALLSAKGLPDASSGPKLSTVPHHHGYHTAPSCFKFEDTRHVLKDKSAPLTPQKSLKNLPSEQYGTPSTPSRKRPISAPSSSSRTANAIKAAKHNLILESDQQKSNAKIEGLGCEMYDGPDLKTTYRAADKLCSETHRAWLAAGGNDSEPRRIAESATVIPRGSAVQASQYADEFDSGDEDPRHAFDLPRARRSDALDEGLTILGHALEPKPLTPKLSRMHVYPQNDKKREIDGGESYWDHAKLESTPKKAKKRVAFSAEPDSGSSFTYPHYPSKAGVGRTERVEPIPVSERTSSATVYENARVRLSDGEFVPTRQLEDSELLEEETSKLQAEGEKWSQSTQLKLESKRREGLFREMFPGRSFESQITPSASTALVATPALDPGQSGDWFTKNSSAPLFDEFGKPTGFSFRGQFNNTDPRAQFGSPFLFSAFDLTEEEIDWWQSMCEIGRCGFNCNDSRNCKRRAEYIRARNAAPRSDFNMKAYLPASYPFPDANTRQNNSSLSANVHSNMAMHNQKQGVGLKVGVTVKPHNASGEKQGEDYTQTSQKSIPIVFTPDEEENQNMSSSQKHKLQTTQREETNVQVGSVLKPGGSGRLTVRIANMPNQLNSRSNPSSIQGKISVQGPAYALGKISPSAAGAIVEDAAEELDRQEMHVPPPDFYGELESGKSALKKIPQIDRHVEKPSNYERGIDEQPIGEAISMLVHPRKPLGIAPSFKGAPLKRVPEVSAAHAREASGLSRLSAYPNRSHSDEPSGDHDENTPSRPQLEVSREKQAREGAMETVRRIQKKDFGFGSSTPSGKTAVSGKQDATSERHILLRRMGHTENTKETSAETLNAINAAKERLAAFKEKKRETDLNNRLESAELILKARQDVQKASQVKKKRYSDSRPAWERLYAQSKGDDDSEEEESILKMLNDGNDNVSKSHPSTTSHHRSIS